MSTIRTVDDADIEASTIVGALCNRGGTCFANAADALNVLHRNDWPADSLYYCEGWAIRYHRAQDIYGAVAHGWCEGRGRIIDPSVILPDADPVYIEANRRSWAHLQREALPLLHHDRAAKKRHQRAAATALEQLYKLCPDPAGIYFEPLRSPASNSIVAARDRRHPLLSIREERGEIVSY